MAIIIEPRIFRAVFIFRHTSRIYPSFSGPYNDAVVQHFLLRERAYITQLLNNNTKKIAFSESATSFTGTQSRGGDFGALGILKNSRPFVIFFNNFKNLYEIVRCIWKCKKFYLKFVP